MYNFALAKNIQISQALKKRVRNVLKKSTNKVREVQKMGKSRIICLLFSLFIAIMDASAQTFLLSQLQGRVWHAKSGYSLEPLVYWDLSFGGKKCKYIFKPKESNSNAPKNVTKKMDYYLCNSIPLEFDEKQSSTQGTYIAFREKLTGKKEKKLVFWFAKIKSVNSKVLILEMENETITFESND